jgi:hypothetical protein
MSKAVEPLHLACHFLALAQAQFVNSLVLCVLILSDHLAQRV